MKLTNIMFCNYMYIHNLSEKEIGTVSFRKFRSDPDISEAFLVTCALSLFPITVVTGFWVFLHRVIKSRQVLIFAIKLPTLLYNIKLPKNDWVCLPAEKVLFYSHFSGEVTWSKHKAGVEREMHEFFCAYLHRARLALFARFALALARLNDAKK